MKKILKISAIILAVVLLLGMLYIANGFLGNPISYLLVSVNAGNYLEEHYGDTDYEIDNVSYSWKTGGYYAQAVSPSSVDGNFSISYDLLGRFRTDTYEHYVTGGFNTWSRINDDYRALAEPIFGKLAYEVDISYVELRTSDRGTASSGVQYGIEITDLEPNKQYDYKELGSVCGSVTLYTYDNEVTAKKAAEILLAIKDEFDSAGVTFFAINLDLQKPRNPDGTKNSDDTDIDINDFLYSDIYEEGLSERVTESDAATKAYYAGVEK